MADHAQEETQLVEGVECGRIPRDALEMLSLLGDARARGALGRLPLVLADSSQGVVLWPEDDPPPQAPGWETFALRMQHFDRSVAALGAQALLRAIVATVAGHREPPPSTHLGLHTGPAGFLHVTDVLVAEMFPLGDVLERTLACVDAWVEDPGSALASDFECAWPDLLTLRNKTQFCAELAGLEWRAVWAGRWLVASIAGPETEVGAALAIAAAYAEIPLGGRAAVCARLREAIRPALVD